MLKINDLSLQQHFVVFSLFCQYNIKLFFFLIWLFNSPKYRVNSSPTFLEMGFGVVYFNPCGLKFNGEKSALRLQSLSLSSRSIYHREEINISLVNVSAKISRIIVLYGQQED